MSHRTPRAGFTLLELIVVLAVLAVLLGLLLPAVQKVREAATRARSGNNIRQLILAAHTCETNSGQLPAVQNPNRIGVYAMSFYDQLYYYGLGENLGQYFQHPLSPVYSGKLWQSPADPSLQTASNAYPPPDLEPTHGPFAVGAAYAHVSSYAANAVAFPVKARLEKHYPDGTSQTIAIAERYARCYTHNFGIYHANNGYVDTTQLIDGRLQHYSQSVRRTSFADRACGDTYPITSGSPPVARPTVQEPDFPDRMFQVAPSLRDCNPYVPQTPYRGGLPVAMVDGSVRTVRPGVAEEVFWAAVTRDGGEVASLD